MPTSCSRWWMPSAPTVARRTLRQRRPQEEQMVSLVQQIERDIAPIEVAVFNIGANVRFGITDTTARVYQKVWEMACFSGFLMGREVARVMLPRGRGTIIFTGATASLARPRGFCRLRRRQACPARAGAEHGARTVAEGHPRRAPGDRRRDRHRVHPQQLPRALRAEGPRTASSTPSTSPTPTGRSTSSRATPGPRDRPAAVDGNLVTGVQPHPQRWRQAHDHDRAVPVRLRQPQRLPGATR
jgi:NAD(P)-dependent dehydrogenase (short-subunit alcohol dehydrogenase family)